MLKNTGVGYIPILDDIDNTNGDYRVLNLFPAASRVPDCSKIPELKETLVREINEKIDKAVTLNDKCEIAFEMHYRFMCIQPFAGGNRRIARLLMNYILMIFDLPMFSVFRSMRVSYSHASKRAIENRNPAKFYDFMYQQYQRFIEKN